MADDKIDWSQFEVNDKDSNNIDWSKFEEKNQNPQSNFKSDDEDEPFPVPRQTGFKGLAEDATEMLRGALKSGKGFIKDLPSNLEKSGKYAEEHPVKSIFHNLGQVLAGGAEATKDILNLPHKGLAELGRKELIPEWLAAYNEMPWTHIPEDTGIQSILGLNPDPEKGDAIPRAVGSLIAPSVVGKISKAAPNVLKPAPDLKQAIRDTQAKVNLATENTGKIFDKIEEAVKERGISKVPVDKKLIKQAESFLSDTQANKDLIQLANKGDYKALRALQSDLRKRAEKAMSSGLEAEYRRGEKIVETRDKLNESIANHLEGTGHKDLAKDLNKARNDYRDIQQTYFSSPQLAKVFGKSQVVPKNPKTLLSTESTEMKKFMSAHPEVQEILKKSLSHEKKMKLLKHALSIAGIGTTAEIAREIFTGRHQ